MKVLFVSSGNSKWGITPIVKAQGESLKKQGIELEFFPIQGKGMWGYLQNLPLLNRRLDEFRPDLVHAHYSVSAIAASLVCRAPMVVSLMGSDTVVSPINRMFIRFFDAIKWQESIVKSESMKHNIKLSNASIIPNGVDIDHFRPLVQSDCKHQVGFAINKRQVIWLANPERYSKNIELANMAFKMLSDNEAELKIIHDISHDQVPLYLNAADVLLLTSRWEGSPNIIKEAMACNCPIVATGVGDVSQVLGDTEGCFVTSSDPEDVAVKIESALKFVKLKVRTNGRLRIIELGLDADSVAEKLIALYENVLGR